MKLKIKAMKFLAGRPVCMIHETKAKEMSLHLNDRVVIEKNKKRIISVIDTATNIISPNEIALSEEIINNMNLKKGDLVNVILAEPPSSINFIREKLNKKELSKTEINAIIRDIANNALTEAEIAFFISAVYSSGMSSKETKYFIQAIVKNGKVLKLRGKVVDKHSIGGVAGNRTTPIIVSICASAGLVMPKTSSRAITSAAGTADVIETIARVDFSVQEIKKIINKTNACIVWGGALGLAPTDDKIIKVGRLLRIDSVSQLLASILSKKISVDSKYIVIDIPYGKSAKVSRTDAEKLKRKFIKLGKMFNLKIRVILNDGANPVGRGIGPVMELLDIIKVLKKDKCNNFPEDLEKKSVRLTGELLELSGKAKNGKGEELAQQILDSGQAWIKFQEIIKEQQGKIDYKKLKPGKFIYEVLAKKSMKIKHIDNELINGLARMAGCPEDKSAGIYLHKKHGEFVKKRHLIMTIYSESQEKLKNAKKFLNKNFKQMVQ